MDNRYYEKIINEMQPFFDENGFAAKDDAFVCSKLKAKIVYNDEKQMYCLSVAAIDENGESEEYREINSWLFDDTQTERDAVSVGIDFVSSLRKELGIKVRRAVGKDVELPSASKSGGVTIASFTKKVLDIYTPLKDEYKAHIAVYGNFLYLNFFGEKLIPYIKETLISGNKKQISKLYDVLEDAYIKGDRDTVNTVVALLCAAAYENEDITTSVREMLDSNKHFLSSFNNFMPVFLKNQKLKSALIK